MTAPVFVGSSSFSLQRASAIFFHSVTRRVEDKEKPVARRGEDETPGLSCRPQRPRRPRRTRTARATTATATTKRPQRPGRPGRPRLPRPRVHDYSDDETTRRKPGDHSRRPPNSRPPGRDPRANGFQYRRDSGARPLQV